ncbi:testis-specific protein pbs13 t-complex 11 [Holotrichia oblita]|uniref:Testis-specific protein pbs13 t-complex 11 n=1 Tax=Holotrichia oblita TaxID=644536 RepID=A0ACB9TB87_HOLOL|nr:testis-specific protein pbs13 t-complex 11 [Holotrichia oblita]
MSSDANRNKKSDPTDVKGAVPRIRVESESSANDDGSNSELGKRQRTTSQTFMVTGSMTAASPPKFVSLEEIIQAANGMKDMALVHQIVVDKDFKLERVEPEPNTWHRFVKDNMHKAFWEILKEELAEDPPNYNQAFVLLEDIKTRLFSVLLPQHTKIKQQISEILDSELIKQQAQQGVIDFPHYAQYVLSVMSKLCAPIRDERIKELSEKTDVIEVFRGILEVPLNFMIITPSILDFYYSLQTLDLMVLDMANFTIELAKPEIIAHSVELERKKFADFLSVQADGLQHTRRWLLRHVDTSIPVPTGVDSVSYIKNVTKRAFTEACIDLLEWDENLPFPETFMLDQLRLQDLQQRADKLILTGSVLLITVSNVGLNLQSVAAFKQSIKEHTSVLLQSVKTNKEMEASLPNIAEQVLNDVKEARKSYDLQQMTDDSLQSLKEQILQIAKPDNRVRQLVRQRVKEFFLQIIESSTADPQKVPSGLTSLQQELTAVAGQFLRIVAHNSTVFCIYYFDIVEATLSKPA